MYSVSFKKIGSDRWEKIENIVADGYISDIPNVANVRWFVVESGERVEISFSDMIFRFSRDRNNEIKTQ